MDLLEDNQTELLMESLKKLLQNSQQELLEKPKRSSYRNLENNY